MEPRENKQAERAALARGLEDSFRQDVSLLFVFISPALVPNRMLLKKPSSQE